MSAITIARQGAIVTVNSDDPALFNTTLNDEAALLADPFGLSAAAIDDILTNAVQHSFLPPARRQTLEVEFRSELAVLKQIHLTK